MKRNWKLLLCLLMAALTLCACSAKESPEDFPDITQAIGPTATPTAVPVPEVQSGSNQPGGDSIFSNNPYDVDLTEEWTEDDIFSEENFVDPIEDQFVAYVPDTTVYPYAGSTPIPLNPVDMPSPTPRPKLNFTYSTYIASTVGVTFEGPVSWMVDESQPYVLMLSEPSSQIRDNEQCVVTISAEPVSSTYSKSDLKTHVNQRLDTIGGEAFTEWKPSLTATRYMMGSNGVYANYSGMLNDGTEVGGRIQYVCIDSVLYGLEIVFPLGFKDDFLDVFGQIRSSMALIR